MNHDKDQQDHQRDHEQLRERHARICSRLAGLLEDLKES